MYDDLVKRLRASVDGRYEKCEVCPYEEDYPCCVDCLDKMHKQAADAIEELSKPGWIPVTERLPEKMQYVLVRYQNNDMAVASWFGGDEHIRFWRAMTDEGWCADCDTEPTHWMPLPQPPKEEWA